MITPFADERDYGVWREINCESCAKDWEPEEGGVNKKCDIEHNLSLGIFVKDGTIPKTIAGRAGLPSADGRVRACPEFEGRN